MVHKPHEISLGQNTLVQRDWDGFYQEFLKAIEIPDYADDIHTVGTGKRIFDALRSTPPGLERIATESESSISFSNFTSYSTRPDVVGERAGRRWTVDFKYTEGKWQTATRPWPIKPLLAYDDQLLGQAIITEAAGFIRGTIALEPRSGKIAGPVYEERLVDGQLRKEWLAETKATIEQIEACLHDLNFDGKHHEPQPVEKNTDSCYAFGKECCYKKLCTGGFQNHAKCGEPK